MKKLCLTSIIAAVYLTLAVLPAWAQGILSVTTDKAQYEYGEMIEISVTIANPTNETFHLIGSSTCQAQFRFDSFDSREHTACTADELYIEFPPGSDRTWIWEIKPEEIGLPAQPGMHTIVGYYPNRELADTISVEAPHYLGGTLAVGLPQNVSAEEIAPVKDSLNAQVLDSWETLNGPAERWRISGTTVDSAVARYSEDARFRYVEAVREIQYHQIVSAEDVPDMISAANLTAAFPNPFEDSSTFGLEVPRTQYVRVAVYDVLGREIEILHEGVVSGGTRRSFSLQAGSLANGLYVYRAEGESFSVSGMVLLAR